MNRSKIGATKKYEVLAEELRREIVGHYRPGQVFSSETELIRQFQVSPTTVRRALGILADERLLRRSQGRRSRVAESHVASGPPNQKTVLLLSLDEGVFFFEEVIEIQRRLFDAGYATMLHTAVGLQDEAERARLRQFLQERNNVDGLICGPVTNWYDRLAPVFEDLRFPRVVVGALAPFPTNYVAVNAGAGVHEALRHLDQIGCRKIRFYGNSNRDTPWGRGGGIERFRAEFRPTDSPESFTVRAIGTVESGYETAAREFEAGRVPDGVLAHNDLCATGILMAARHYGIRIPEDVALAGFDNIASASSTTPSLTTVAQPKTQVAQEAVRILTEAIQQPGVAIRQQVLLQPNLILRESTLGYARASAASRVAEASLAASPGA